MLSTAFRQLFAGIAFIACFSVAAVERRHAYHRRHAKHNMDWSNFAGISVTGEAQRIHAATLDAAQQHDRRAQAASPAGLPALHDRPEDPDAQQHCPPKKVLKKQTPRNLFRSQWLKDERIAGRQWNPCSSEAWAAVRQQFEELAPDVRATFEAESVASGTLAERARAERQGLGGGRAGQAQQGHDAPGRVGGQPLVAAAGPAAEPPQQHRADVIPLGLAMGRDQELAAQHGDLDAAGSALRQGFPISPQALESFFAHRPGVARVVARSQESLWKRNSTRIVKPAGPDVLPASVNYSPACGAVCKHAGVSQDSIRLYESLVRNFGKLCIDLSPAKKAAVSKIALADLVFAVELFAELDPPPFQGPGQVVFCAVTTGSGRFAHHPESSSFCLLDCAGGEVPAARQRQEIRFLCFEVSRIHRI
jgi:hypothetical protein